jgi:hypothetical protein
MASLRRVLTALAHLKEVSRLDLDLTGNRFRLYFITHCSMMLDAVECKILDKSRNVSLQVRRGLLKI